MNDPQESDQDGNGFQGVGDGVCLVQRDLGGEDEGMWAAGGDQGGRPDRRVDRRAS